MNAALRCGVVGAGRWGSNLLRTLQSHSDARVCAVVDPSAQALHAVSDAPTFRTLDEAIPTGLDAVFIATPPETHARLAAQALEAGLHVFVEKPLTTDVASAERLVEQAARTGRVAMVGHLLRYHPAVETMLRLVQDGQVGRVQRFFSVRSSAGTQRDGSALWSLGPHDLSVLQALDPSALAGIRAYQKPADSHFPFARTEMSVHLRSGLHARLQLARTPKKRLRHMMVVGERATLFWNDAPPHEELTLLRPTSSDPEASWQQDAVPLSRHAPLSVEVDHFLRSACQGAPLRTPFEEGARVVRWLSLAERSIGNERIGARNDCVTP